MCFAGRRSINSPSATHLHDCTANLLPFGLTNRSNSNKKATRRSCGFTGMARPKRATKCDAEQLMQSSLGLAYGPRTRLSTLLDPISLDFLIGANNPVQFSGLRNREVISCRELWSLAICLPRQGATRANNFEVLRLRRIPVLGGFYLGAKPTPACAGRYSTARLARP